MDKGRQSWWGDEEGGAKPRPSGATNLSGTRFSTRDFAVDQSVNLMDMGGDQPTNLSGAPDTASGSFSVSGLFRGSATGGAAGFDEYGDAAASTEAEEYISDKRRRMTPLGASVMNFCSTKVSPRMALALVGAILLVVGVFVVASGGSGESTVNMTDAHTFLISTGVTSQSVFAASKVNAQNKAVDWLMNEDALKMSAEDQGFVQRYALAVFYFGSTNAAAGWVNNDGWMTGSHICDWYGVECTEGEGDARSPTRIDMKNNKMGGSIPDEFGQLTDLQIIEMTNNELTGTLPMDLADSTGLRDIFLGRNSLVGTLPPSWTGLKDLHQVDLSGNQLTGEIPSTIEELSSLRSLSLSTNLFTGQFPSVKSATQLLDIDLDDNDFDGALPEWMSRLKELRKLRLSKNRFSGSIPVSFEGLKAIEELHLDNNHFEGEIPDIFDHLPEITNLHLQLNKLKGPIPRTVWHLHDLKQLSLYNNDLTGTISNMIGTMSDLQVLALHYNHFSGTLPSSVGNMLDLKHFTVNGNRVKGAIPAEIGNCFRLETLHLDSNKLTGTIPESFTKLEDLKDLRLEINGLDNTAVPQGLCSVDALEHLSADCQSKSITCGCCTQCV